MSQLRIPATRVVIAEEIQAGAATDLPPTAYPLLLPALCRVSLQLTPSADSNILMEIWIPLAWNGSFRGVGNGGLAGAIDYTTMAGTVIQGYAVAATDTGHSAAETDATWALDHPEKVKDFGYRAIHLMTLTAQKVIQSFSGAPVKYSFFDSCSDGGREALMEAQRFPDDYNGIIAGDAAYNWTGFMTAAMLHSTPHSSSSAEYVPAASLPLIGDAVNAACDAADGVVDGIVGRPELCQFKPETLLCKAGSGRSAAAGTCLSAPQVGALKALYSDTLTRDGALISHGYEHGGEVGPGGWEGWITGLAPQTGALFQFSQPYFADMVYGNPQWTSTYFDKDQAYALARARTAESIDATSTDLVPFFSRGGKLIMFHGWSDPAVPPASSIQYFNDVSGAAPRQAASSMRLFMVPGMQHCGGGPGPSFFGQLGWFEGEGVDDPQHDINLALEQWVKLGVAPETLTASAYVGPLPPGETVMTRPLCAYPKNVTYNGSGDTNDAANFSCRAANVQTGPTTRMQVVF